MPEKLDLLGKIEYNINEKNRLLIKYLLTNSSLFIFVKIKKKGEKA